MLGRPDPSTTPDDRILQFAASMGSGLAGGGTGPGFLQSEDGGQITLVRMYERLRHCSNISTSALSAPLESCLVARTPIRHSTRCASPQAPHLKRSCSRVL